MNQVAGGGAMSLILYTSVFLYRVETGRERVQAHHSRHPRGEDHGPAEVQDEHSQHHHQPGECQPAEHGNRPAP